jgi:hypothetical protein
MLTFPTTVVQGSPAALCLYKVVAVTEMSDIEPDGTLRLQGTGSEQWKIGLRENLADAVERTTRTSGPINKDTHVVLEITFSPLGLSHYAKICKGPDYRFQPMLQKITYRDATDWKAWHFHGDLPMQASDDQGNVLITTRVMEIC